MTASESERNRVIFASMIASCWKDQAYRDRFIADPNGVCLSEGIVIPEGVKFVVKENNLQTTYVVLPTQDVDEAINTFSEVLKTLLPLPEGHSFTLVQNTEQVNYIVIPAPPAELGIELSDDAELELAVGGAVGVNAEVAANAVAVANAAAWANVAAATLGVVAASAAAVAVCVLVLYPFNVPEFLRNSPVKNLELE